MKALGVVGVWPARHWVAGLFDAEEQGLGQEFVARPAVERLAVPIVHRLAEGDVVPLHLHLLRLLQDRIRGERGAVVGGEHTKLSKPSHEGCEFAGNPTALDRGADHGW